VIDGVAYPVDWERQPILPDLTPALPERSLLGRPEADAAKRFVHVTYAKLHSSNSYCQERENSRGEQPAVRRRKSDKRNAWNDAKIGAIVDRIPRGHAVACCARTQGSERSQGS
jgi:hypothetical protein